MEGNTQGEVFFTPLWSNAVGMAWSSRSQVQGHKIAGSEMRVRLSKRVLKGSKVGAEVNANAWGARAVVRLGTQVPHRVLMQAAGEAARLGGRVVGSGVAAGNELEGTREDGAGSASQTGEGARPGHRLAGSERQPLVGQVRVLAGGPPRYQGVALLVLVAAPVEPNLLQRFSSQVQCGGAAADSDGGRVDGGRVHVGNHCCRPNPFVQLGYVHQLVRGTQIHCVCEADGGKENKANFILGVSDSRYKQVQDKG